MVITLFTVGYIRFALDHKYPRAASPCVTHSERTISIANSGHWHPCIGWHDDRCEFSDEQSAVYESICGEPILLSRRRQLRTSICLDKRRHLLRQDLLCALRTATRTALHTMYDFSALRGDILCFGSSIGQFSSNLGVCRVEIEFQVEGS